MAPRVVDGGGAASYRVLNVDGRGGWGRPALARRRGPLAGPARNHRGLSDVGRRVGGPGAARDPGAVRIPAEGGAGGAGGAGGGLHAPPAPRGGQLLPALPAQARRGP